MTKGALTSKQYWEAAYRGKAGIRPFCIDGWRNLCLQRIHSIKARVGLEGKSVLEVGGGGSRWLAFLAKRYPDASFACLDYSKAGTDAVAEFRDREGLRNLEVHVEDFFAPSRRIGPFDIVYSHGVVEHFTDLPGVLAAHARFLKDSGRMLTFIPNMRGVPGWLVKRMNRAVYDLHVPHDEASFVRAHADAGLEVLESGYVCSSNFSVLSSCVSESSGFKWQLYKALTRVNKAIWFLESRTVRLPVSRAFSPYLYAVSRKRP